MKPWSIYNHLFRSERFGSFLYNALNGIMLELDQDHFMTAGKLRDGFQYELLNEHREFLVFLEKKGFLALREDELLLLMQMHYQRNVACFSTSHIGLTICPTLACNFGCPYCFEHSQNDATVMSDKTMDALVSFIKKHHDAKNISVSWYGGEPTLAFDIIKSLTSRFIEIYPEYNNVGLVTNAYQLDQGKIDHLEELKVTSVQITLDGSEKTHNSRRMLKGGIPTYRKILNNIELLMQSSWKGHCSIRVNVDRTNQQEYAPLRAELLGKYKGKNLLVYPGYIKNSLNHDYDHQCGLCNSEWTQFTLDCYKKEDIVPRGGFYPESGAQNTCIATSHYGYVIGPKGEIYKCWEDVGKEHMIIGSVHDEELVGNRKLVTRYSIGTDPFNDSTCMECPVMPVCGGGCINKRMRSQQFGEKGIEFCSPLKESLISYLEAYLDTQETKNICASVLGKSSEPTMKNGYCMVQPEQKKKVIVKNPLENLAEPD
jgi:uncharacterized protein